MAKRYDEALHRYTQVIRLDPTNAWAYLNRSGVFAALGDAANAEQDYQKARQLDPKILRQLSP